MIEKIIGALIIGAIGVFEIINPKLSWEIYNMGFVEKGEPTKFALKFIRCFGLFLVFVAVCIVV